MESPKDYKNLTRTKTADETNFVFHAVSPKQVAERFAVEIATGLSTEEANRRLSIDGANIIEHTERRSVWKLLLEQFSSIIIWLLAFAAIIAWLTDSKLEAVAILVVLLINAAIGFLIEWQAGRALEALKKAAKTSARVRRDRTEQIIDAENLATGDIVILSAGDRVPADARILESANLRSDESTLTGESVPVEKKSAAVEISAPLAERHSMLYLGTTIVGGNASAIVTATGEKNELGRIGQMISEADDGQTPLQKRLADLGKRLVYVVFGIALIVLLAGVLRGDDIWLMLEVAISLAVAAVPEGLPAVTTLILALGVLRMARRNAIVRRLAAVETLGSSTVICTDKTGTLTENRMTVQEYRLSNEFFIENFFSKELDSVGKTETHLRGENLFRLLRVSVLCNEASFDSTSEGVEQKTIGDPTETALLVAAEKFGFDIKGEKSSYKKLREYPFDASTKKMITVVRDKDGQIFAAMKGAPGVILDVCDKYISKEGNPVLLDDKKRGEFLQINRHYWK